MDRSFVHIEPIDSPPGQSKDGSIHLASGEVINTKDVELLNCIGHGGYGTIYRGRWQSKDVAVKFFQGRDVNRSSRNEIEQLSRFRHVNIIEFYGICVNEFGPLCMVTEFADCGSLFFLLHTWTAVQYGHWNAVDWALQCARGVYYLHSLTPKAVVHRDLKTLNLLLCNRGMLLKICDFGTACDVQTVMTNNKGSAAWMAPEVFEGSSYDEKCDVYSWSIILWELLSRRIPFEEMFNSAYQIMWAVHNNQRPPDVVGCPPVLDSLMKRCWDANSLLRPSMQHVVTTLEEYATAKFSSDPVPPLNLDVKRPETPNDFSIDEFLPIMSTKGFPGGSNESHECSFSTIEAESTGRTVELFPTLEQDVQPILPMYDDPRSVEIYEQHVTLCERLAGLRKQIEMIRKEKETLAFWPSNDNFTCESINRHIWHVFEEKQSLIAMRNNFLQQIEELQNQ